MVLHRVSSLTRWPGIQKRAFVSALARRCAAYFRAQAAYFVHATDATLQPFGYIVYFCAQAAYFDTRMTPPGILLASSSSWPSPGLLLGFQGVSYGSPDMLPSIRGSYLVLRMGFGIQKRAGRSGGSVSYGFA